MGTNLPNFDRADYAQSTDLSGTPVASNESVDHAAFVKAIVFGLGAAVAGSLCYATFSIVTHIKIGYLAIGVAWLIAKALMFGSENLGGRKYQIAASLLTYFAVSMAAVPELLWGLHKQGNDVTHASLGLVGAMLQYGLMSPFLGVMDGVGGIIGLVILVVGIRYAWQVTAGRRTY